MTAAAAWKFKHIQKFNDTDNLTTGGVFRVAESGFEIKIGKFKMADSI